MDKKVLIPITVAAGVLWLLLRGGETEAPAEGGPSAIEDIILSQDVCLHIRRDNAVERAPGTEVEITVVLSASGGGVYRAALVVFNAAGEKISALTDTALMGAERGAATVRATIVAPEFVFGGDNAYDVEATLELLQADGIFGTVIDPETGGPVTILLENALKIVPAVESGETSAVAIFYQERDSDSYDQVYR